MFGLPSVSDVLVKPCSQLKYSSSDHFYCDTFPVRADRLISALLVLQSKGRVTAAELADELEISIATARRDLEALSSAGIPVYPQSGRGGGWQLVGGARTDLSGFSASEAQALFLLVGPPQRRRTRSRRPCASWCGRCRRRFAKRPKPQRRRQRSTRRPGVRSAGLGQRWSTSFKTR